MYDEVFSPSFGNRPSFLVGREQLLDQLEQGLQSRPGGSVGALGFSAGIQLERDAATTKSPQQRLVQLCRQLTAKDREALILIDELQASSLEIRRLIEGGVIKSAGRGKVAFDVPFLAEHLRKRNE